MKLDTVSTVSPSFVTTIFTFETLLALKKTFMSIDLLSCRPTPEIVTGSLSSSLVMSMTETYSRSATVFCASVRKELTGVPVFPTNTWLAAP